MITERSSLADVCFAVSTALESSDIPAVLTGGSAAAVYAPQAYMSHDADFVFNADEALEDVAVVLQTIGFLRKGRSRIFVHSQSKFTIDFPKGPLAVGGEYLRESRVLERDGLRLRILTRNDCIKDRLSHYYYWKDFTALNAAVAVAAQDRAEVDLALLRTWSVAESPEFAEKFAEFESRLSRLTSNP